MHSSRLRLPHSNRSDGHEIGRTMPPADLRAICDLLNDERGSGGQSRLARLLKWHHSTVWRKLNGESPITKADARAIQKAVELAEGK